MITDDMLLSTYRELRRWKRLGKGFLEARRKRLAGDIEQKSIDESIRLALGDACDDKINLLGHSFGGLLAIDYALDHPSQVREVMTVASAYKGTWGIHWSHVMRIAGLYYPEIYHNLKPNGPFIERLTGRLLDGFHEFERQKVYVTNVVAGKDEFVAPEQMSLVNVVGESRAINEFKVDEGHCESLFAEDSVYEIKRMMGNGAMIFALPPILHDRRIFDGLRDRLSMEENRRFVIVDYDYTKRY